MECGPLRKGTCPQRGSWSLVGWWMVSINGRQFETRSFLPNHPSTCALSVTAAAAFTGMAGDGGGPLLCVLGSFSHGHSVYISSAPESRSPSLHSRPKVAHLQRLMCLAAHLRNRAFYGSQTEILLTQPHTIESWRRVRSGGAQFLQRIDGDCFSYY